MRGWLLASILGASLAVGCPCAQAQDEVRPFIGFGGGWAPRWGDDDQLRQGVVLRADGGVRFDQLRIGGVFVMHVLNDWAHQTSPFGGSSTVGWFSNYLTGPSVGFRVDVDGLGIGAEGSVLGGPTHVVHVRADGDTEDLYRPGLAIGGSFTIDIPLSSFYALGVSASLYALFREDGSPTLVPMVRLINEFH
ncbi:MAG: hypothetical protein AB7S26_37935 [Sandaracinaceae bacterium]